MSPVCRPGSFISSATELSTLHICSSAHDAHYDLALADIVLGTQDRHEIAESLVALQPGLRVVLMSGYGIPRYGADPRDPMLSKPFQADQRVERVERALAD
jgi:DNA-binding NtrC family response regulator